MKKEDFVKVLEIFEYTGTITGYNFLIEENAIRVFNGWEDTDHDYTYYFDENDNLIHPQIINTKKKNKTTRTRKTSM